MTIEVGKVVPGGGVFGVELEGLLVLDAGGVLILGVVEETAEREVRAGMLGMAL